MRVLISGAGVAGPTLVWFLARLGARITVVEKASALLPHGQNVDLQGSALKIINKMGLMEQIRNSNTTEKGTRLIDSKGRPFARFPLNKECRTASPTSEFEILRGDLSKVLYESAKDHPNIEWKFSTTIDKVLENGEKNVKVELSSGEVQDYDFLVAADGQWSKVRKQCFPQENITVVDKNMYVCYWTIPRLPDDNDWWNVYFALGSRAITLRPDPHGTMRAMFTLMPRSSSQKQVWEDASRRDRKTQQELLRKEFADAGWQAKRLLDSMDQAPDFYFQAIKQIRMTKWSSSRVICLGDTAFAPTPLTGMGSTLAIEGAYLLAAELSKIGPDEHPSKAFDAYEGVFRGYVEKIQDVPFIFPGIMHPETALRRWMVQTLIWTISKVMAIPWLANKLDENNDDDFALPPYPTFDEKCCS